MIRPQENRLGSSNGCGTTGAELEQRVMLMAPTTQGVGELTRAATGNPSIPEDGFGSVRNVGGTGVGAVNNAWNQDGLNGRELLATTSLNGELPRITVTKSPSQLLRTGAPYGFPALIVGSANGNSSSTNPFGNNGIPISEIESLDIQFNSNGGADNVNGTYNNTLDVWFGTENNGQRDVPSALLMLQNYNSNIEGDSTNAQGQPAGRLVAENLTFDGLSGTYDLWFGENAGTEAEGGEPINVISYVRRDQNPAGSQRTRGDLNLLIKDAVERRYLDPNLRLDNIYAGTETWQDAEGAYNEFSLDVNNEASTNSNNRPSPNNTSNPNNNRSNNNNTNNPNANRSNNNNNSNASNSDARRRRARGG